VSLEEFVSTAKRTKANSAGNLKREIAALRSTVAQVWTALVDIDDASSREEALDAVDDACEIIADWPRDFEMTDEVRPEVQQQIELEAQIENLAREAEQTQDWSRRATLFRKALALVADVDEQYIEQQVEQMPAEGYRALKCLSVG
jgi:hypothetical protein